MKTPPLPLPAFAATASLFLLAACDRESNQQEGVGTIYDKSPSGALGTTGTGADQPAPPDVQQAERERAAEREAAAPQE